MGKNIKITKFINNSMLDLIYKEREDSLYQYDAYDKEEIKKMTVENPITHEDLLVAIKNLPPHFKNTRELIIEKLERYIERQNRLIAYDNEKFYKSGFCDGVQMMMEILIKENNVAN